MTLKEQITNDMKTFMKDKNQLALDTVRMLRSDIKYAEIESKSEMDDAGVQKVIASSIKKRKDSAQQYTDAGRPELAEKEMAEVEILMNYMPKQISEEEVRAIVKEASVGVDISDKRNFGKVMQVVMAKVAGRAEGKIINQLVKEVFDGNN